MKKAIPEHEQDVAIIGLSCRFPGAPDAAAFWRNLRDGVESITPLSDDDLRSAGVDPEESRRPDYVKAASVLQGIELFDAPFFGFSAAEAEITDPQHRLFLECAWEALEDAGYDSERCPGLVGLFAGACANSYLVNNLLPQRGRGREIGGFQALVGNDKDYLTTRVSYKLNLRGPSVGIQTACSTSLVAVHLACESLLSQQCDMALAGGVTIKVPQGAGYRYEEGAISSPDGHCRAFDAKAAGTVPGNGAGIVVLKRLADALADGDCVRAVVKGSAVNNDGSAKVGYTAPGLDGQADVVAGALAVANVAPEQITYVEAHGTGTPLGDPVEIGALTQAFGGRPVNGSWCAIGTVKSNIGHLDTAAGVAGLVKTVLALQHGLLPPSLHFQQPNPRIPFDETPFRVNAELRQWDFGALPRRAGVSSFGIGGTNAHVVLEEAPRRETSGASRAWQLLPLSARSAAALDKLAENLAAHLRAHPELPLADVAFTLQSGRRRFAHRRVVVCRDRDEALRALTGHEPALVTSGADERRERPVLFVLPDPGGNGVPARLEPEDQEQAFRDASHRCFAAARDAGLDTADAAAFAVQYATAVLWQEWGVAPAGLIGQGTGEYVAACLASVLSLEDAARMAAARAELRRRAGADPSAAVALEASFLRRIEALELRAPTVPCLSSVTGSWLTAAEAVDPRHWARQATAPLAETPLEPLAETLREPDPLLLRIGVDPAAAQDGTLLARLQALGRLWLGGAAVDWSGFSAAEQRQRVPLPVYPFERRRYWIDPPAAAAGGAPHQRDTLQKKADIAEWFSVPTWKGAPQLLSGPGSGSAEPRHCWLAFVDRSAVGTAVVQGLRDDGHDVVTVMPGAQLQRLAEDTYELGPSSRSDYDGLLSQLASSGRRPSRVVHLWTACDEDGGDPSWQGAQARGFVSLMLLAQALGARGAPRAAMTVVTSGVQDVESADLLRPERATVLGACKVIPQEYPEVACRTVDVKSFTDHAGAVLVASQILQELRGPSSEPSVAYRGSRRWLPGLEPVRLPPGSPSWLRQEGVYLVTGGFGGIGLTVAEHLARAARARLVLTGRTPLPPRAMWSDWLERHPETEPTARRIRAASRLEALGARVLAFGADVTDEAAMRSVVAQALQEFGAVHGVVHAAGIPGGGVIQGRSPEAALRVLAPKVEGACVLDTVLGDLPLDFMVLFSSTIAVAGGLGQADYCAANAFLDAYARRESLTRKRRCVSIDWDAWEKVGMAVAPAPGDGDGTGRRWFSTRLSARDRWELNEHRMGGRAALPGTASIEAVVAAFQSLVGKGAVELSEVVFPGPLFVDDGESVELDVVLEPRGQAFAFEVGSRSGGDGATVWREHARGRVRALGPQLRALLQRRELIESRELRRLELEPDGAARRSRSGFDFGPRWQTLREVHAGEGEALARLELPEACASDVESHVLHPALLDTATSFAIRPSQEGSYLPVAYGRVVVLGALPSCVLSHVRRTGAAPADRATLRFDVVVASEDGTRLVEIEGLVFRRVGDLGRSLPENAARSEEPRGILPAEGLDALDRIMAHGLVGQVVVCAKDVRAVIEAAASFGLRPEQAPLHERPLLATEYVAPTSERERTLARVWRDVLRVEPIGVHDDFFELGGDSLVSLQIVSRAAEEGLILSADALFQHPTVAGLAASSAAGAPSEPPAAFSPGAAISQRDFETVLRRLGGGNAP